MPSKLSILKTSARTWLDGVYNQSSTYLPPRASNEKDEDVVAYVRSLFTDSARWREQSLQQRFQNFGDPVEFWRRCRLLEQGMHWDVWGKRNNEPGSEWKHEIVDNLIGNQTRVRKSYLNASWHDFTITPNLAYVNEIIQQERDKTDWGRNMVLGSHRLLVEGTTIFKIIFDRTEREEGVVRELVLDNESVFPTPQSTSLKRLDGCWYFIHATVKPIQDVLSRYPKLKESRIAPLAADVAQKISVTRHNTPFTDYVATKFVEHYEVWLDDPALENAKFDPAEVEAEIEAIQNGQPVEVKNGQAHNKFIERYLQILDTHESSMADLYDEEDRAFTQNVLAVISSMMEERKAAIERDREEFGIPSGKVRKYPYGRRIIVVGDQLVEDKPNPLKIDWRAYFRKVDCETLPNHFWGRGVAEILWNTNHTADTALSRIGDLSITVGMPKPYFGMEDRELLAETKWNQDPTKPAFYTSRPPTFPRGQIPTELSLMYNYMREKSTQEIGINAVTYGEAPTRRSSNALAETLLRQNIVLVTGEANTNLNTAVEDIVETRLKMMRELYTEPRYYIINGKPEAIMVSRELKKLPVFEVNVKPNSNFPNQWEDELAFVLGLATQVAADGMPFLPREAVIDTIAQRYPQFGQSGKYYQISEILKLGIQTQRQMAEQQNRDRQTQQQVDSKLRATGIQELMSEISGGNGNGKTTIQN